MDREVFIVCGSGDGPIPTVPAICSKCNAVVGVTEGTLIRACDQGIPLICMDCFAKVGDYEFGGAMHEGHYLPELAAKTIQKGVDQWRKLQGSGEEK